MAPCMLGQLRVPGPAVAGNFWTASPDGFGVLSNNTSAGIAVAGFQSGSSVSDLGGYWKPGGLFGGQNGVVGITTKANSGVGVFGLGHDAGSWAGYFTSSCDGVGIPAAAGKTGLSVSGGSKSAVVATDSGSRLLYTEESTEVWFTDYGFAKLTNGTAKVTIDPIFAQTVNLKEPYHVFVQVYGDADVYVTDLDPDRVRGAPALR